nr:hypothetical protein [Streptomyces sp. SID4948]
MDPASAAAPQVLHWPGRAGRLLVQRGDREVVTVDLGTSDPSRTSVIRFPAPWPRRFGTVAVSPDQEHVVFAGPHAVRSVDAGGATRWEVRHGCWDGSCPLLHRSFAEYADDEDHFHADSGSAMVNADGTLVWIHVRGPLAGDTDANDGADDHVAEDDADDQELWLVVNAADGEVMGRVETTTVASGSEHTPHPDPTQMGLSIAEGEEDSPVLWGHWNGRHLTAEPFGIERILLGASPSGRSLLTVPVGQWSLTLQQAQDGAVLRKLDAQSALPPHPDSTGGDRVYWDYEAAFLAEDTVVAGSSESDARNGAGRHWLVDLSSMTLTGEVSYPFPVSGPARSAGCGTWYTVSKDQTTVHIWQLGEAH